MPETELEKSVDQSSNNHCNNHHETEACASFGSPTIRKPFAVFVRTVGEYVREKLRQNTPYLDTTMDTVIILEIREILRPS